MIPTITTKIQFKPVLHRWWTAENPGWKGFTIIVRPNAVIKAAQNRRTTNTRQVRLPTKTHGFCGRRRSDNTNDTNGDHAKVRKNVRRNGRTQNRRTLVASTTRTSRTTRATLIKNRYAGLKQHQSSTQSA